MRKLSDIPLEKAFPEAGKHNILITAAEFALSEKKKTPYIELTFFTGELEFNDCLFLTPKCINRLSLVAQRICGLSKDTEIPDDDQECVNYLSKYIVDNIVGKRAIIEVVEFEERFICQSGKDAGRTITKKKRRVAFNGYESAESTEIESPLTQSADIKVTEPSEREMLSAVTGKAPDPDIPF